MITIPGCDYSLARPNPAALYGVGVRFAARYVASGRQDKLLTPGEYRTLVGAGLDVVAVVEGMANWMLGGRPAGTAAAIIASNALAPMIGGDPATVYFAADWDVSPAEVGFVLAALDGAGRVLGTDRVGLYGGARIVTAAQHAQSCRYFWQTRAWSDPTPVPGVHIWQPSTKLPGFGDVDMDTAFTADFGRLIGGEHDMLTDEEHGWLADIHNQVSATHGPGQTDLSGTLNTTLGVVQHLVNTTAAGTSAVLESDATLRAAVLGAIAALPTAHLDPADRDAIATEVVTAVQAHGVEIDKDAVLDALAARLTS